MKIYSLQSDSIIAIVSGLWLYFMLLFLAPFDTHDVSFSNRSHMMLGYGVIFSLSYYLATLINLKLHRLTAIFEKNNGLVLLSLVFCGAFFPSYIYYKSDVILGESGLGTFFITMYAPLNALLLTVLHFIRRKVSRVKVSGKIILRGKGKQDELRLTFDDLIAVKSANNYVEVHYLELGMVKSKLLRQSLKNMGDQVPQLVRTHRSHLVNPSHITSWKDKQVLNIKGIEVPVSEGYRQCLLDEIE